MILGLVFLTLMGCSRHSRVKLAIAGKLSIFLKLDRRGATRCLTNQNPTLGSKITSSSKAFHFHLV
jgi:hypothetical protein